MEEIKIKKIEIPFERIYLEDIREVERELKKTKPKKQK